MYYLRVLHVRIKTFEKTEEDLLRKYLYKDFSKMAVMGGWKILKRNGG